MNLYLRVLLVLIASFFKPKTRDMLQTFKLRLHVLPNDLDTNMHMNNGRYATIMDLGRFDMILRNGLMRLMIDQKSVPILSALSVRYRIPLHAFEPYDLETRVLCWDDKWVFMEQRFVLVKGPKAGAVAAIALLKGGFYDQKRKTTVPTADLMKALGVEAHSPPVPDYVLQWQKSEESLRAVTAEAA
jgi:acyl-CoA thioesterase FadM